MNFKRIKKNLKEFNQIGYTKEGMNRLAFTKKEKEVKFLFKVLCENEGMKVRYDESGNVIARMEGKFPELSPVVIGSHLDTVFNGGQFDGTIGVAIGLEIIRRFNDKKINPKRSIEVICFAGEEASRFGTGTIGSKGMTGLLNEESLSQLIDHEGISFPEAIKKAGLNFKDMKHATRKNDKIHAFFEVHIEQGTILEKQHKKIGIVTAIAAPTRLKVSIAGKSSHSGTTPMEDRKDALLGAAEISLVVEDAAKSESKKGTVGTVGDCKLVPAGAMNTIPGHAEIKIDIRGINIKSKKVVVEKLTDCFKELELRRKLNIKYKYLTDDKPIRLDESIVRSLSKSCEDLEVPYLEMISGAGHDAMNMATICPTGLIFIPCKEGLSHHKDEHASINNIVIGAKILEKEIEKWIF